MRKMYLWENVRSVFRFPRAERKEERKKFELGPLRVDKKPGPVKVYNKEVLVQWGPM